MKLTCDAFYMLMKWSEEGREVNCNGAVHSDDVKDDKGARDTVARKKCTEV